MAPSRPRLLISNKDPFTGLALLENQICEWSSAFRRYGGMGSILAAVSPGKRTLPKKLWPRCAPATFPQALSLPVSWLDYARWSFGL